MDRGYWISCTVVLRRSLWNLHEVHHQGLFIKLGLEVFLVISRNLFHLLFLHLKGKYIVIALYHYDRIYRIILLQHRLHRQSCLVFILTFVSCLSELLFMINLGCMYRCFREFLLMLLASLKMFFQIYLLPIQHSVKFIQGTSSEYSEGYHPLQLDQLYYHKFKSYKE